MENSQIQCLRNFHLFRVKNPSIYCILLFYSRYHSILNLLELLREEKDTVGIKHQGSSSESFRCCMANLLQNAAYTVSDHITLHKLDTEISDSPLLLKTVQRNYFGHLLAQKRRTHQSCKTKSCTQALRTKTKVARYCSISVQKKQIRKLRKKIRESQTCTEENYKI